MTQLSLIFAEPPAQQDAHIKTRETAIKLRLTRRHRKEVKK